MALVNNIRRMVQSKLNEIEGLEAGIIVAQDMVEEGRYYFGYDIRTSLNKRDLSYDNEQYTISLVGYLSTKGGALADFDKYLDAICDKLGELRFRPTTQDSPIAPDTGYRECMLTAYAQLNTLEKTLR
ncbi:MAG: hypothetical protein IKB64_00860 [Paludibacteraceae bacterium]|nr:hypothetical protein [Paludibacteraceae bacterium]